MRSFSADVAMPVKWPAPPSWLSFTAFREIETCPMRWGLTNADYTADWCSDAGYPLKPNHAAIRGLVIHRVIETLVRASVTQPERELSARLVAVLRQLGGLSAVISKMLDDVLGSYYGNPRAKPLVNQYRQGTVALPPLVGARIQSTLRSLATLSVSSRQRRTTDNNQSQSSSNGRLAPGVYPEVTLYSGHRWFGKIDLLLINADVIRIEEIKSGKPKPEDEEQILVYAWLWWRDEARNPARTSASQLAIRYPDQTINIPAPSESELKAFETKLLERSSNELGSIERGVFTANPGIDTCRYCQVRQLCDRYWTEIMPLARPDSATVDLDVVVVRIVTPRTWEVQISNGSPFESAEHILLKGNLPTLTVSAESLLRVIDAFPVQPTEGGRGEMRVVRIGNRSEVFVVG